MFSLDTPLHGTGAAEYMSNQSIPKTTVHYSPFRYPGGKSWLVPYVRQWISSLGKKPRILLEPFAGGANVGLSAAIEGLVDKVILIEKDSAVAAVWQVVLSDSATELIDKIGEFRMSRTRVKALLKAHPKKLVDRALKTIVMNRVRRGGILRPEASLLRRGENGRGLLSRWYPETLCNRIRTINEHRNKFEFHRADGLDWISKFALRTTVAFFIDPPYVGASARLYEHSEVDHEKLIRLVERLEGPAILTYDNSPKIRKIARERQLTVKRIAMKNTHHTIKKELIIGNNLDWLSSKNRQ